MLTSLLSLLFVSDALAVPLQVTQQGRILEASGAAVSGVHNVTFRIYDDSTGGNLLWTELMAIDFTNGYYAAVLGADEPNNPLDSDTLSLYPLFLELQVGNNTPMSPRHALSSAPYAQMAGVAESVDGGPVNASELSIGAAPVIDSGGHWVGQPITVDWSSVTSIPSDLADGDNDTQLSEVEVETMVTNDAIDLAGGSTVAGSPILTAADATTPDWTDVTNRPPGLDDGDDDTQLSEAEVEGMVTNGALSLAAGTTIGGKSPVVDPICSGGQVLIYNASSSDWECGEDTDTTLTEAEMQTMIEAMTVNFQNRPQVNGDDVLTSSSTVFTGQIDGASGVDGQVLSLNGGTAEWADSSGGGCEVVETIVGSSVKMLLNCGGSSFLLDGNALQATSLARESLWESDRHCAVRVDGGVSCWGYDDYGQVSDAPSSGNFIQISSGFFYSCGVESDGGVTCWGLDNYGQVSDAPSVGSFTQLSSGYYYSCGLKSDGGVTCWGSDNGGVVSNAPSSGVTQIFSGQSHVCGLESNGGVTCWGRDNYDQSTPPNSGSFIQLSLGESHSCGLASDGGVICWGRDNYGQVSNAPNSGSFTQISSGYHHSCGVKVVSVSSPQPQAPSPAS